MKNIEFKAIFLSFNNNQYNWLININGQEFKYFQGSGHFTSYYKKHNKATFGRSKNKKPENGLANTSLEGWLHKPTLDDVMYCLLSDMTCGDETFNDFCDTFGYTTDSIKALKTYHACQENGTKLKKAIGYDLIKEFSIKLENY